jgi:hypothetical protein
MTGATGFAGLQFKLTYPILTASALNNWDFSKEKLTSSLDFYLNNQGKWRSS